MQIIEKLEDWGYPVIRDRKKFETNLLTIRRFLWEKYYDNFQIVGTGNSGSLILGGLSMLFFQPRINLVLLPDQPLAKRFTLELNDKPIVIIDDHITYGGTLGRIFEHLRQLNKEHLVEGVVMTKWYGNIPTLEDNTKTIEEIFPDLHFWLR